MNVGAQICVIHRVRKIAVVVWVRSSGRNVNAAVLTKSRVWSTAMITMTIPRSRSIEAIRRDVIQCSKEEPQIPQITQIGFFVRGAAEAAPYVRPAVDVVSP